MAFSYASMVALVAASILVVAGFFPVKGNVRAVNNCPFDLMVYYVSQAPGMAQFHVPQHTNLPLNVPYPFIGGVVWASQNANSNRAEATQLEFNLGPKRDYYDVSLVNAYNLPASIVPTYLAGGDVQSGLECGVPTCIIRNINSVCHLKNYFAGPDSACINVDGPGNVRTPSSELFSYQCPSAFVTSNDASLVVYGCNTGSQYDIIWCP